MPPYLDACGSDIIRNRKMTSFKSIHTDLAKCGAAFGRTKKKLSTGILSHGEAPNNLLPAFISKLKEAIDAGPKVEPRRAAGYVDHYENPPL